MTDTLPRGGYLKTVLVIVISTNDGRWLTTCLDSLSSSTFADFDLMVVANACSDDTVAICNSAPLKVEVIMTSERRGFAECNNIALKLASARNYKYAFLLNPDTKVHPVAIGALVSFLESNSQYGIVGSQQISYHADDWLVPNVWTAETIKEAQKYSNFPREVGRHVVVDHYYVQGAALMMRLSLIPWIGLLDPLYITFYEETDLCRRCLLAGHRVGLVLDSKIKHYEGGNWKRSEADHIKRDFLFLRNQFLFHLTASSGVFFTVSMFTRTLKGQLGLLFRGGKDVILPLWRYPSVLLSALSAAPYVFRLRRRNRSIRNRHLISQKELAIGPAHEDEGQ